VAAWSPSESYVLEKNPPKQGLKLYPVFNYQRMLDGVLEKNPPKQGLKPRVNYMVTSGGCRF